MTGSESGEGRIKEKGNQVSVSTNLINIYQQPLCGKLCVCSGEDVSLAHGTSVLKHSKVTYLG